MGLMDIKEDGRESQLSRRNGALRCPEMTRLTKSISRFHTRLDLDAGNLHTSMHGEMALPL